MIRMSVMDVHKRWCSQLVYLAWEAAFKTTSITKSASRCAPLNPHVGPMLSNKFYKTCRAVALTQTVLQLSDQQHTLISRKNVGLTVKACNEAIQHVKLKYIA